MKIIKLLSLILFMLLHAISYAQVIGITGKITDAQSGQSLPGVTVGIKSKQNNVSANADGIYQLQADPSKDILVFSYVGYKRQEIKINGRTTINISLEEDKAKLEEVIVVGYGTKKKSEVIGAVATIKASEIADVPTTDIAGALRNRIAGVGVTAQSGAPGATISLNIRDARVSTNNGVAVGATSEPLYIIDGIYSSSAQFSMLDASMVETITILKDASAAIYGSSGSKGVVLITTKRGKLGKPSITYNGYYGINDAARKPEMLSGYDHAKLMNDTYDQQGFVAGALYFSDADLQYLKDNPQKSWFDEIWQPSVLQRHNVGMSGGSDKITFFVGGSYQNQNANYKGKYYERKYSFRSGLTASFSESLKADIGFNVNYNNQFTNLDVNPTDQKYMTTLIQVPQWVPIQINGMPVTYGGVNNQIRNPLAQANAGFYNKKSAASYTINTSLVYTPKAVPGLAFRFQLGQTGSYGGSEKYTAPYKTYTFAMTGNNGLFYTDRVASITDGLAPSSARLNPSLNKGSSYQGNITANYAHSFGDHKLSALVGAEQSGSNNDDLSVYWDNQQVAGITDFWAFDQSKFTFGSRGINEGIKQSFFGRFSYDYKGKYLLDAVGRFDGSSNFAKGHVWGFFPNVGVAWILTEEKFFKNISSLRVISFLKLKANVGLTGDDRVSKRLWQARYKVDLVNTGYMFGTGGGLAATLNPQQIPNPEISWAKKRTINLGLESAFFNGRLTFGFDYFHDFVYDEFDKNLDDNFPMYAGFAAPVLNNMERHIYGTEFSIGYNGNISKDLTFNGGINFSFNNSYVSNVFLNPFKLFQNSNPDWQIQQGVNERVYNSANIGLISKGILRTQADVDALLRQYPNYTLDGKVPEAGWLHYEDQNGDGKIDERDMVPMFKNGTNPFTTLGSTLGFNYKGFQLRANIVAVLGGKMMLDSKVIDAPSVIKNVAGIWADHWSPANPDGRFPRSDDPTAKFESTFWATNATMIRVNNMSLAYTISPQLLKRTGLSSLRVLLTGNNLWVLKNPQPFKDPYSGSIYDYPTIRTISVGLGFGL